jgi:chromosome segregation ATPase
MPGGEETPGDRGSRESERDLLAERRARRELGDPLLTRRAEAAEATVRTLEAHLSSLQVRLQQSSAERDALTRELAGRELEVRRVKQREHAEQQLRVEAEEERDRARRQTGARLDELRRLLLDAERRSGKLEAELERVRRELSEVQQAMALGEQF